MEVRSYLYSTESTSDVQAQMWISPLTGRLAAVPANRPDPIGVEGLGQVTGMAGSRCAESVAPKGRSPAGGPSSASDIFAWRKAYSQPKSSKCLVLTLKSWLPRLLLVPSQLEPVAKTVT